MFEEQNDRTVTMNEQFHLAQFNISKLKADLNETSMSEFVTFLDPVNHWADKSSGFIWRLKDPQGHLKPVYDDPRIIINLSVWQDIESLSEFTFGKVHNYFLKNRSKWMDQLESVKFVMWWITAGHTPTVGEAKAKLLEIELQGPSPSAFNWHEKFSPL